MGKSCKDAFEGTFQEGHKSLLRNFVFARIHRNCSLISGENPWKLPMDIKSF